MSATAEKKHISSGPLECKVKLEGILARATVELQSLLAQQLSRLHQEYEAIRAAHFPFVRQTSMVCSIIMTIIFNMFTFHPSIATGTAR